MNFKVDQKQMLRDLKGLLSIASTNGDAGAIDEMTPLGKNINDAIDYMLAVGKRFGFETQNLDGCCGIIDMGEGEEMVGVLVHIDTVPVGEGWSVDPFDGTVIDGKVYGRFLCGQAGCGSVYCICVAGFFREGRIPVCKFQRRKCMEKGRWSACSAAVYQA